MVVDKDENIYVVGYTDGAFPNQVNLGDQDAFLLKINANGELVWTRQFGSIEGDFAFGVALDQRGSVYVAGVTTRDLQEQTNARNQDVFVRVFGPNGGERLNQHLGTDLDDHATDIMLDISGNIYISGWTRGVFRGIQLTKDDTR